MDMNDRSTGEQASKVADAARAARDAAKDRLRDVGAQVRQQAEQVVGQVKESAADAAQQLRERGESAVSQQKDRIADQISGFSEAFRQAANTLNEHQQEPIGRTLNGVAQQIDSLAGFLRDRSATDLINEVSGVIRRRPEVAIGVAFVAGLAFARFLKASQRHSEYGSNLYANEGANVGRGFNESMSSGDQTWRDTGESFHLRGGLDHVEPSEADNIDIVTDFADEHRGLENPTPGQPDKLGGSI
jgi:ElaB/YqjD/DUF883 family membrane-anchored ribosome-binding protein